jgi:antitoxin HicB
MNKKFIGSDFDDFLEEEGLLEQTETVALKRVLAFKILSIMEAQNISKTEMAKRMKTSRASLDRLLDPLNCSVTLYTMNKAARSVGARLQLSVNESESTPNYQAKS